MANDSGAEALGKGGRLVRRAVVNGNDFPNRVTLLSKAAKNLREEAGYVEAGNVDGNVQWCRDMRARFRYCDLPATSRSRASRS
jgi:hypothetical protein